jgi:hypothetical protein
MGDPSCQLADAFHLLGVTKLTLQRPLFRDVLFEGKKMRDLAIRVRYRRNRRRFPVDLTILLLVAELPVPNFPLGDGGPQVPVLFGAALPGV